LDENNLLNNFIDEHWSYGKTEVGQRKLKFYRNLYKEFLNSIDSDEENEIEETENSSFAYESDLRDYLAKI